MDLNLQPSNAIVFDIMSKRDKTLTKWKKNTPKEVNRNEIEAVLNYFFEGKYRWDGTSHIVLQHDELIDEYPPYGEISIPCKGGKRVKGR